MDEKSLTRELEKLLSEDCDSIKQRERTTFDKLAGPFNKSLVIFGTGGLGRRTLAGLRKIGIEPLAFCDNNMQLWNKAVDGLRVLSPEEAVRQYGQQAAFIVSIWSDKLGHPLAQITEQLKYNGAVTVVSFASLYWKYSDAFLPYFGLELPHRICSQKDAVRAAGELWMEDTSRKQYLAQLRWRLWLDSESMESSPPKKNDSIFTGSYGNEGAVIVDCGAFNGDTVKSIIQQGIPFKHLLAIEPDPANCMALRNYLATLPEHIGRKILVFQSATGARRATLRFSATGSDQSSLSDDGNIEVECVPLDEIAYNYAPTFIKMDIEGAEPEALLGARRIISDFVPKLAISIYHQFDHLWKLPLLINKLDGNYDLSLYPMAKGGWDLMCVAARKQN